jgi:hypothetical protein
LEELESWRNRDTSDGDRVKAIEVFSQRDAEGRGERESIYRV